MLWHKWVLLGMEILTCSSVLAGPIPTPSTRSITRHTHWESTTRNSHSVTATRNSHGVATTRKTHKESTTGNGHRKGTPRRTTPKHELPLPARRTYHSTDYSSEDFITIPRRDLPQMCEKLSRDSASYPADTRSHPPVFLPLEASAPPTTTLQASSPMPGRSSSTFGSSTSWVDDLGGKRHFRVVTVLDAPFTMVEKNESGGYRYVGFCVDLINAIADHLGFTYELYEPEDGQYGAEKDDGTWSGMVGELISGRADIALAAMTISSKREKVIDFTARYMDYGTGLIMKKPKEGKRELFAFFLPFEMTVWIGVMASIFVVAVLLSLTSLVRVKLNLVDHSRHENDADFDLRNSAWFSYASLLRKGVEPQPRSTPNRILAGAWWLFGLIAISTYTANLTAFLTVKRLEQPIRSVDDLVKQTKIKYGIPKGGSTYAFFRDQQTTGTVYELMWNYMNAEETMVRNVLEGIKDVKKGDFVLMYDTPMLEYLTMTDETCEMMMVGKSFRHLGYGLATPHGNRLSHMLSLAILKLKEGGKIDRFRNVWWPTVGCALDGGVTTQAGADRLGLDSFYGVFVIVGVGVALTIIYLAMEVIWTYCCKPKTQTSETEFSLTKQESSHQRLLEKDFLRAIDSGMVQIFIKKTGGASANGIVANGDRSL
ncbi:GRIA1 [Branchiostoma lanceolatum]|uniref:GRIA1 protein n=1 Tax=Branchiostoma lanceolatum TaxID=7740 RepID=A0A8J9ZI00_BRALA|nr:GRIA1 [Branchiostoma lanceolatum]